MTWKDCWRQGARAALVAVFVVSATGMAGAQQAGGGQAPAGQAQMPNMPNMRMPAAQDLGIVSGTVSKASGGPVSGATVVASNATNGIQFSATTDDEGKYNLPSLPVGTYEISAQLGGFKPFRQPGVIVDAKIIASVNPKLEPGDADSERQALLDR